MFTLDCDRCGTNADEGTDYSCWGDKEFAIEMAKDGAEFREVDGKYYCPECMDYDEESDEWKPKT